MATYSEEWLAELKSQSVDLVVFVTLRFMYPSQQLVHFSSHNAPFLGAYPGLVGLSPVAQTKDEESGATTTTGSWTLEFTDDGVLRDLNASRTLRGKLVTIRVGSLNLPLEEFAYLADCLTIDEVLPISGNKISIQAVGHSVLDTEIEFCSLRVHPNNPLTLIYNLLREIRYDQGFEYPIGGFPAGFEFGIDADSFNPANYPDIAHWNVCRQYAFAPVRYGEGDDHWLFYGPEQIEPETQAINTYANIRNPTAEEERNHAHYWPADPPFYPLEDNWNQKASDTLKELSALLPGTILESADGFITYKHLSLSQAPVRHFTLDDYSDFEQLTGCFEPKTKVIAKGLGPNFKDNSAPGENIFFEAEDQEASADLGVKSELLINNPYFSSAAAIMSANYDTQELVVFWPRWGGFCGTEPTDNTMSYASPSEADFEIPEDLALSEDRPAYLKLNTTGNTFGSDPTPLGGGVVKAIGFRYLEDVDEINYIRGQKYAFWIGENPDLDGPLTEYLTNYNYGDRENFTHRVVGGDFISARDYKTRLISSGYYEVWNNNQSAFYWKMGVFTLEAGSLTGFPTYDYPLHFQWAEDVTIPRYQAQKALRERSRGRASIKFNSALSNLDITPGDVISGDFPRFMRDQQTGADENTRFEIWATEPSIFQGRPGVSITAKWLPESEVEVDYTNNDTNAFFIPTKTEAVLIRSTGEAVTLRSGEGVFVRI